MFTFSGQLFAATEIVVQAKDGTNVVQSIAIKPTDPPLLADMVKWMNLGEPDLTQSGAGNS